MRFGTWRIGLLVLCSVVVVIEIWHLRGGSGQPHPNHSGIEQSHRADRALLPESEITAYSSLLPAPRGRIEGWEPTVADVESLEDNLSQIRALSGRIPDANRHIDNPQQYFRQYLAVAIDGRRAIFVNALCSVEHTENWRKRLAVRSGDGKCFWHAVYDPATQKFSDLAINPAP